MESYIQANIIDINTIVYFTTFKTVIRYCIYVFIYTHKFRSNNMSFK